MSDYDGQYYAYKVYVTCDVSRDTIVQALTDDGEEELDKITVESRSGQTTQSVITHHRENTTRGGKEHPSRFLVVDSADLEGRGVLLVSLAEYHGFNDGLRFAVKEARDNINSLCVANDDWFTFRESIPAQKTDTVPVKWYALYNLLPADQQEDFDAAFAKMNEGVQMVGVSDDEAEAAEAEGEGGAGSDVGSGSPGDVEVENDADASMEEPDEEQGDVSDGADDEVAETVEDELPKFYKAVTAEGRDLEQIIDQHSSYANENRLDSERFAVIDKEYKKQGPLILRIKPETDSFRCRGDVAGEVLRWMFVNLMTWDEAKSFAGART
ncbi:hypothetical protein C8034_v000019 [Colletotrichum sidae]|uniref:Uncharacterized protein n=1 Tax=Colletotrichum sidae TaxID=1347389 RepID=A0A4R8SMS4_9PEZI|nr:hypothetical protein C8034_v000019 [Colletotrichum sidae]